MLACHVIERLLRDHLFIHPKNSLWLPVHLALLVIVLLFHPYSHFHDFTTTSAARTELQTRCFSSDHRHHLNL